MAPYLLPREGFLSFRRAGGSPICGLKERFDTFCQRWGIYMRRPCRVGPAASASARFRRGYNLGSAACRIPIGEPA